LFAEVKRCPQRDLAKGNTFLSPRKVSTLMHVMKTITRLFGVLCKLATSLFPQENLRVTTENAIRFVARSLEIDPRFPPINDFPKEANETHTVTDP